MSDIINIYQFFPNGMTKNEQQWLAMLLQYDFPGREIILQQLSQAQIVRKSSFSAISIGFDYRDEVVLFDEKIVLPVFMIAYQGYKHPIEADLYMKESKVDELFIFNKGDDAVDLIHNTLDNVEHEIRLLDSVLEEDIRVLYEDGIYGTYGCVDFKYTASIMQDAIELAGRDLLNNFAEGVARGLTCALRKDLSCGFCIEIDLWHTDSIMYRAEVFCSSVANYACIEIKKVKRSMQEGLPDEVISSAYLYPNGSVLGAIRGILTERGYTLLSRSQTYHKVSIPLSCELERSLTVRDFLFGPESYETIFWLGEK